MNPKAPTAPVKDAPSTGEQKAKKAVSDGSVDPQFADSLSNLFNCLNYSSFSSTLQYRIASVLMICNSMGIMAGRQGGKAKGTSMAPTSYRDSMPSGSTPFASLPTSVEALQAQSQSTIAPPEYGDSQLVAISRSNAYNPAPIRAEFKEYAEFTGPPLAPRNQLSRVITNYGVSFEGSGMDLHGECGWDGITNDANEPFLQDLFDGKKGEGGKNNKGGFPSRDLSGATSYESEQIERQIGAWFTRIATGRNIV